MFFNLKQKWGGGLNHFITEWVAMECVCLNSTTTKKLADAHFGH